MGNIKINESSSNSSTQLVSKFWNCSIFQLKMNFYDQWDQVIVDYDVYMEYNCHEIR